MNRYQTFGSRFLAAIIDSIFIFIVDGFIRNFFPLEKISDTNIGLLYDFIFYAYSVIGHYKFGQTFGKKLTKVKVVRYDDESRLLGFVGALKRDGIGILLTLIGYFLSLSHTEDSSNIGEELVATASFVWAFAEIITMLFNKKRRAVHDLIAGSVVIDCSAYAVVEAAK